MSFEVEWCVAGRLWCVVCSLYSVFVCLFVGKRYHSPGASARRHAVTMDMYMLLYHQTLVSFIHFITFLASPCILPFQPAPPSSFVGGGGGAGLSYPPRCEIGG